MRTLLVKRGVRVGFGDSDPGDEIHIHENGEEKGSKARKAVENLVRGERCDGYSGADLAALVREAGVVALKRTLWRLEKMEEATEGVKDGAGVYGSDGDEKVVVEVADFVNALDKVNPSVSVAQRRKYEGLRNKFAGLPVRNGRVRVERGEEEDRGGAQEVVPPGGVLI